MTSESAPPTRTLLRGLRLLEALADMDEPTGVTELARHVELDKATVSRLLRTLVDAGYAAKDPKGRYRIASKILRLSDGFAPHRPFLDAAMPHLRRIRDQTNETTHLGQMENDQVVYVEKLDSMQSIRLTSAIGQTNPLHTTALGKAILAAKPLDERTKIVERLRLEVKQPNSIRDPSELLADLDRTSSRGYSIDDCENEENVTCIGAAIEVDGEVLGAVSVAGPSFRIKPDLETYSKIVVEAAHEIGVEEGKRPKNRRTKA